MHDLYTADQSAPRPPSAADASRRADLIPMLALPLLLLLAALSHRPATPEPTAPLAACVAGR